MSTDQTKKSEVTFEPPKFEIAEYSATAAGLAELSARLKDIVYPVSTKAGMMEATKDRAEVRKLRVSLEALRKEIKAPALKRCELIDAEARDLRVQLEALEEPIDQQIKKEEQRIEAEKQAKIRAEQERVDAIRARIDVIANAALKAADMPSADIAVAREDLAGVVIDGSFGEFVTEAKAVHGEALIKLERLYALRKKSEDDAAQLARDREELARLQREDDARRAREESERVERERVEREKRDAEEKARRDELARQELALQAKIEAQRKAQAAADAEAAARREEQDRKAAEERARLQAAADAEIAERKRLQDEQDAKARADLAAEQKRQAEERERLAALQAQRDAEEKARRDAEAKEKAANELREREERDRLHAAAPVMLSALREVQSMLSDHSEAPPARIESALRVIGAAIDAAESVAQ